MADEPETPEPQPIDKGRPIIVIRKKKGGHGGHHGGAWKVAYADFVTAMMALFIVLWLMSSDQEVKEAIAQYFRNPTGPGKQSGTAAPGVGKSLELAKQDMEKLKEKISEALKAVPKFESLKDHVEMTITPDGLRIELLETNAGMFFESGKAIPTEVGAELFEKLAEQLGKLPNGILLEGHTDAKAFGTGSAYTNWELSTDRANAARRLMDGNGLRHDQVSQIRGFADRQLRHPDDPDAASNRRVSVIVQYLPTDAGAAPAKSGESEAPPPAANSPPKGPAQKAPTKKE